LKTLAIGPYFVSVNLFTQIDLFAMLWWQLIFIITSLEEPT